MESIEPIANELPPNSPQTRPENLTEPLPEPTLKPGDQIQVLRPDLDDCDCALPQETIDLFRGIVGHRFVVRGFDRYGHIEIWAMDDGSPSESACDHSVWVSRSAVRVVV
jgi:hypothetical protein